MSGSQPDIDNFQGVYIQGDQFIVLENFTTEHLELVLLKLAEMIAGGLVQRQTDMALHQLTLSEPGGRSITLSETAAERLLEIAGRQGDERPYLAALAANPGVGCWAARFTPLAGRLDVQEKRPDWAYEHGEFDLLAPRGEGDQVSVKRIPLTDLCQAFDYYNEIVIQGEPGAGKSTQLNKLALDAAQRRLQGQPAKLPLLLPLAGYRGFREPYDYVEHGFKQRVGAANLAERLHKGDLLLLFDALNEMPFNDKEDYQTRVRAFSTFLRAWPGNQVAFTCRSRDYSGGLGLAQVEIERMDEKRVQDFLLNYLGEKLAAQAWERLEGSTLFQLVRNPYYLSMLCTLVWRGGRWPEGRAALFQGFVAVLMERERGRPGWPGAEAMEAALSALAARMQPQGEGTRLPKADLLQALPGEARLRDGTKIGLLPEECLRLGIAASLLDVKGFADHQEQIGFYHHQLQEYFAACELLQRFEAGEEMAPYWRQPALKGEMPAHGALGAWEGLPAPPPTGWEEPTLMAAGLAAQPGSAVGLTAWVEALNRLNPVLAGRCLLEPGLPELAEQKTQVQQALLARLSGTQIHLRARLLAGETLGRLGDPRFSSLEVDGIPVMLPPLAQMAGGSFKMGSTAWEIYRLKGEGFIAGDEAPRRRVPVGDFWIGVYPVTNAEFRCFYDAGGYKDERWWPTPDAKAWRAGEQVGDPAESDFMGAWKAVKQNPEQWLKRLRRQGLSAEVLQAWEQLTKMDQAQALERATKVYGQRLRDQPAFWDDERFANPAQPVVGVTWFEALAYCAWLEEQAKHSSGFAACAGLEQAQGQAWQQVGAGRSHVRLPSEAQWEYAGRGASGRRYPWGGSFDPECANTLESRLRRSSPVGSFSQGVSPFGVNDLSGNAWEWCSSLYQDYPVLQKDGREDLYSRAARVVRGGSWLDNSRNARCASRNGNIPSNFSLNLGFRVVLSLAASGF